MNTIGDALPANPLFGTINVCLQTDWKMSEDIAAIRDEAEKAQGSDANARQFASLYAELRRLADRELRRYPGADVSPTTLVHEAYLNLMNRERVSFPDSGKCLGYVARAMRESADRLCAAAPSD